MVYRGTLQELGDSEKIRGEGVIATGNMGIYRERRVKHRLEGWRNYSYIKLSDEKIRNVAVPPMWDDLLREAVGHDVQFSIGGKTSNPGKLHPMMAMRTPEEGLVKPPRSDIAKHTASSVIRAGCMSLILGFFVWLASWLIIGRIIGALIGSSDTGALIGFGVGLLSIPVIFIAYMKGLTGRRGQINALG